MAADLEVEDPLGVVERDGLAQSYSTPVLTVLCRAFRALACSAGLCRGLAGSAGARCQFLISRSSLFGSRLLYGSMRLVNWFGHSIL
jgi:hypothetical protein